MSDNKQNIRDNAEIIRYIDKKIADLENKIRALIKNNNTQGGN